MLSADDNASSGTCANWLLMVKTEPDRDLRVRVQPPELDRRLRILQPQSSFLHSKGCKMPYQYCVSHVRLKSKVSNAGSFTLVLALRIAVVCRCANRIAGSQLCLFNSQEVSKCFRALGCKVRRLKSTCVALQEKSASWLLQAQANLVAFHVLLSVSSLGEERLLCVDGMAAVRVCVALQLFLHMSSVASRFTVLAGLQVQANLVAFSCFADAFRTGCQS